ncbi:MAG TPA: Fic family protein [Herpetosiphonaceae bacterium]|nr:Fic family protein [Herpetosiphonaceae bacterium]
MNYLSRDELLDLHTFALERYGGRLGIRSQDRLIAALGAPQQVMFGVELYPDLASKTATLGFMVLKNRPFNAANEATALLGMLRLLQINGAALDPRLPSKLAAVLRSVLHSDLDRDDLAAWLREELPGSEKVKR